MEKVHNEATFSRIQQGASIRNTKNGSAAVSRGRERLKTEAANLIMALSAVKLSVRRLSKRTRIKIYDGFSWFGVPE